MDRGMSAAMIASIAAPHVQIANMIDLALDSGTVRMTDAAVGLSWSGQPYTALHMLSVSDIAESDTYSEPRVTLALSGVDQAVIALVMLEDYLNRRAYVRKAVFDDTHAVVSPCLFFAGRLDRPVVMTDPDDGTCTVAIDIVARSTPLGQARGRLTSTSSQSLHFPDDQGFDDVNNEDDVIIWGRQGHRVYAGGRKSGMIWPTAGSSPFY